MEKSLNLIYGRNPIREAINSKRAKKIYLSNSFSHTEILKLIEDSHLPVIRVNNAELDKMCNGVHQGVAAEIKDYEYYSFESILQIAKKKSNPVIVILDGINDTHNLGAILRSCDVFDVSGIVMGKHNQVPLNATVAKASAGAINYVPVCLVNNLNQAIAKLKEEGFWIVSTDGSGNINYQDLKYDFKVGLVIGSEGQGVSHLVLKNSDYIVKIPQYGHVNSLNASVAAGILLSKIRQ
jgi:23S rRNA (guanosine2251-2'-O)-methyltransferase